MRVGRLPIPCVIRRINPRPGLRLHTLGGLWIEADPVPPPLGPRRMGLLAIVAAAGRKGVSRDRVLGILWAESEEEAARHTLAQNLYSLKRQTGREMVVASPALRLGPDVTSDVGDLHDALAARDLEAVVAFYAGDFLDGFYVPGVPEFERWVEDERGQLRSAALQAHEQLAARWDERGAHRESIRLWRRLSELDPLSARYAAGTMRTLAALGDRPAALAHFRTHEELVRRELESEPDPSVRQLVAALRSGEVEIGVPARPAQTRPVQQSSAPIPAGPPTISPDRPDALASDGESRAAPAARFARRLAPRWVAALAVFTGLAMVVGLRSYLAGPDPTPPLLAVGSIRVEESDTTGLGPVVRDMLATSLGAIPGLQVVANSRLVELTGAGAENDAVALNEAARRAGAAEVIEGEITSGDDGLTLTLRRIALASGVVRSGHVIRGTDRAAMVSGAAFEIARELGRDSPGTDLSVVRTSSPQAYALYEEGLRAYFSGSFDASLRLMNAALDHDSTFAMAAFYAWLLRRGDESEQDRVKQRARRLAPRTTERERLLIEGSISLVDASIAVTLAIAETLSVRYPGDPDGQLLLGEARYSVGDWAGAVAAFDRVVAMDSAAGLVTASICRVCAALNRMSGVFLWWDSAAAAERTARRMIALRPDEHTAWGILLEPLLRLGRRSEAEAAAQRQEALTGEIGWPQFYLHRDLIRAARFEDLDRELGAAVRSLFPSIRNEARWLWLIGLRDQGRMAEAAALALNGTIPGSRARMAGALPEPVHVAFLPFETGQPLVTAAQLRDRAALERASGLPPAIRARAITWSLTLAGTALAAAGDTAAVRALADTVEQAGRESNFGRDPRLHYFLRGLVLQAEHRHTDAVAAFQRAMYSTADGYTRINLMLAQSLLALGRAQEAVAVLRPALHGGIDGSNTYLTRTEIHLAMADAFAAAGMPDSAAAHYRAVERAWRNADPEFRSRY